MTRGRRPDAGLEPSRQLLTQRAFRQRRAAHLADLEEKISRLERENATLKGIEYVEQERGDRSMATKRMKSEASEGSQAGGWPDGQDVESETASSSCEMCAHHEREKEELIKAVAVVDSALLTLSGAMQTLRQSMSQPPEKRSQTLLHGISTKKPSQSNNTKHKHIQSNTSFSSSDGSAFASSSSSDMLNVSLPTMTPSNQHLKRHSIDEQDRGMSNHHSQRDKGAIAAAAAAASARPAGSANATCAPSSGDCCSNKSNPIVQSILPTISSIPQLQHHQHQHHHLPPQSTIPLAISRHRTANGPAKTEAAAGLAQFDIDDSKCCLGLFECDSNGNFIAN